MMKKSRTPLAQKHNPESGNIFFMLFASIALIGAMTVGAGNTVKGIVMSMSDVTRKTVAEEKMQGAARISIMNATTTQTGNTVAGDCDADGMVEPLPARDPGTLPAPVNGGLVPENIGATTKDPWGTEFGYCAWDPGSVTVSDNNAGCGGNTALRLDSEADASKTVVAVISAGKDRKFSTTCNTIASTAADCSALGGADYYNDPVSGHCYFISSTNMNGSAAEGFCSGLGGHAVNIGSSAEQTLLATNIDTSATSFSWIGGNDNAVEGEWRWIGGPEAGTQFWSGNENGAPAGGQYTNWVPGGEPNGGGTENFAALNFGGFGSGQWVDEWGGNSYRTICEVEPGVSSGGPVTRSAGSDDIVMEYTYNDANGMSGDDLWKIKDTKPGTAMIDKNIDVSGSAELSGPLNLMRSGLVLPGDDPMYVCDATTDQQLRINFSNNPAVLEICDFTGGGDWIAVSMGDSGGGGGSNLPAGAIGYWPFDDGSGTTAVDAAGSNDGTVAGGGSWITGKKGGALLLNSADVNMGSDASLDQLPEFSVCAWVWIDSADSEQGSIVIAAKQSGGQGWYFNLVDAANGVDTFFAATNSAGENTAIASWDHFDFDDWQHVCATYDGGNTAAAQRIYYNGSLTTVNEDYTNTGFNPDGAYDFTVAGYGNMRVDEVVLYDRVLTLAEVNQVYQDGQGGGSGSGGLCAGATNPFDECDDGSLYVGEYNGYHYYTTRCDQGQTWNGSACTGGRTMLPWNNGNSSGGIFVGTTTANDGQANTTALIAADSDSATGGTQPHQMAQSCADLTANGQNDWFLPAQDEVYDILWQNRAAIGGFTGSDTYYGTSTESHDAGTPLNYVRVTFPSDYVYFDGDGKPLNEVFRCMRRAAVSGGGGASDCTGLGTNHYNDAASGHCYFRLAGPMDWTTAKASCEADGAYLASIGSSGENAIVESLLVTDGWIGATDQAVNEDWRWTNDNTQFWSGADSGSPVGGAYNNWSPGEPNDYGGPASENCAFMFEGVGDWNDEECNGGYSVDAICEKGASSGAPTAGLVLYYPFNDLATARNDASPSGNNDAIWGFGGDQYEFDWTAAGRIGGGAVSNNSPDGISAPHDASLNTTSFTISAWINPVDPGTGDFVQIMNKWDGGYRTPYYFGFDSVSRLLQCGYSYGNASDWVDLVSDPVPWGVWSHVVCTFDNTSKVMKTYINGVETDSATLAGTPDSTTSQLWIGWLDEFSAYEAYEGVMDEVRLYNRALTPAEVTSLTSVGGGAADLNIIPDTFLTSSQGKQCTTAGKGPLVKVGESDNSNYYRTLSLLNGYLFAGGYNTGVSVFDMNGDGTVTKLDTNTPSGGATSADSYFDGSYYYVANGYNELVAYTFDGNNLTEVASIDTPGFSWDVKGYNRNLFVADGDAVRAFTFDGTTFTMTGEFDLAGHEVYDLWTDGRFIYASANSGGLVVLTFDGTTFTEVSRIYGPGFMEESFGDGRYIYANATGGLMVYSFDGTTLTEVTGYASSNEYLKAVYSDGVNIYAAWDNDMLEVLRFNGIYLEVLASYYVGDEVDSMRSDGSYLYVGLANSPMLILSGVACQTSSNNALGVVLPAANPFEGKLSVNENGACAIKPEGAAWCWGGGSGGELGDGTSTFMQESPVRVAGSGQYVSIAGAGLYTCGIKTDGTGWCWGGDDSGRLGNGAPTADQLSPTPIAGGYRFSQIAAGDHHACGLAYNGKLYCWGENGDGQLGIGTAGGTQDSPVEIVGGKLWSHVAAGGYATCGIDTNKQLWCWGHNDEGILGSGENVLNPESDPVWVRDPGPWVKVAVGFVNICGIKADGSLWCWGYGEHGVTGTPTTDAISVNVPIRIADSGPWVDITLSSQDDTWGACGIKQDGTAWCWGREVDGNFGDGAAVTGDHFVPSRVLDPGPWAAMGISTENTCGMKTDGSVWCWGNDSVGQLGNGAAITGIQHVPTRVAGFPNAAPWAWDDAGMNIAAAGTANIALGTTGVMGYTAPGFVYDCSGYSATYYNDPATGHCYYRSGANANWSNAQAACGANGGYLAAINSASEHAKVNNIFGSATEFWIGASDSATEGSWVFTGGEKAGEVFWTGTATGNPQNGLYNGWNPGVEPSASSGGEDCGTLNFAGSPIWHDSTCTSTKAYICEIGIAEAGGGLGFPAAGQTVLQQYESGSELLIETGSTTASAQISLRANSAANTRSLGIDHSTDNFEFGLNTSTVDSWMHDITPQMAISPDGNVGIGTGNTIYNKLQINGGLKVGNDTTACNVSRAGTLRYPGGSGPFEYCNGSVWTRF